MRVLTTNATVGQRITKHFGLVSGEAIMDANAFIGVDLDYETIGGSRGSMLMVNAIGTEVLVEGL